MKAPMYLMIGLLVLSGQANAITEHEEIANYTGPETCVACHRGEARNVQQSVHYVGHRLPTNASPMGGVWRTNNPSKWNANTLNNFCTNPAMMGVDSQDDMLNEVCLKCHIGVGLPPTTEPTDEQLANIDCLMCHHEDYTRKPVRDAEGTLSFVPEGSASEVLAMARNLQGEPTRKACLKCHAYAGGADGVKTSLNSAFVDPEGEQDEHMKRDNFTCATCHYTRKHKFRGRGLHIVSADSDMALSCQSCHGEPKHEKLQKNGDHLAILDCKVCHIPFVGVEVAIETSRDFEAPPHLTDSGSYHPASTTASNVIPKYMWRSPHGETLHYVPGSIPTEYDAEGKVVLTMFDPASIAEGAKVVPVIRHITNHPIDEWGRPMIPDMPHFFGSGDIDGAMESADAFFAFWGGPGPFSGFGTTVMNIQASHGVSSKELKCNACHTDGERRDNLMEAGLIPPLGIQKSRYKDE